MGLVLEGLVVCFSFAGKVYTVRVCVAIVFGAHSPKECWCLKTLGPGPSGSASEPVCGSPLWGLTPVARGPAGPSFPCKEYVMLVILCSALSEGTRWREGSNTMVPFILGVYIYIYIYILNIYVHI